MNTSIIQSIPDGAFEEVSIHNQEWEATFLRLIRGRKRIKYNLETMPVIPEPIEKELGKQSYRKAILESDNWQHFLFPG
jgi:hypothetical protein